MGLITLNVVKGFIILLGYEYCFVKLNVITLNVITLNVAKSPLDVARRQFFRCS